MLKRQIHKAIVHCSDTPTGRDVHWHDINEWHRERWGPSPSGKYIGYHWVITIDGVIEMGRPESEVGAHCAGQNKDSIGICLVGRGVYNKFQIDALYFLLAQICTGYALEAKQVFGHCEFNQAKTCPILDMDMIRENLEMILNSNPKGG